jgi:choice-of-anchor C domain-containing protein
MVFSSRWSGAVLISSVSFLLTVAVAQADLVNRSFEIGTDPGDVTALPPQSTAIDGWTVVGSNIWYVGGRWKHADGLRSVGLLCGGGISQTFATEPDQKYEVRFNMAGAPNTLPAVKTLAVSFGTENRTFTFDTTGRSLGDMGWEARFWVFAASDTTTTITLLSPKTECSTPAVDNVRITAVEIGVRAHPDGVKHHSQALLHEQVLPVRSPRTQPASIRHSGSSRDCQRRGPLCV